MNQTTQMEINYINIGLKESWLAYCRDNGGFFAGLNSTVEELAKFGANVIQVHTDGGESSADLAKLLRRINKIAEKSGYINEVKVTQRYQEMDGIRQEWIEVSGLFVRRD